MKSVPNPIWWQCLIVAVILAIAVVCLACRQGPDTTAIERHKLLRGYALSYDDGPEWLYDYALELTRRHGVEGDGERGIIQIHVEDRGPNTPRLDVWITCTTASGLEPFYLPQRLVFLTSEKDRSDSLADLRRVLASEIWKARKDL